MPKTTYTYKQAIEKMRLERENEILKILKDTELTSSNIAERMGLLKGTEIASLLRSMADHGLIDNSRAVRGSKYAVVLIYKLTPTGAAYARRLK